ncbi:MAG: YjbH domain-containing protein [Pseudomonadota bacterium]
MQQRSASVLKWGSITASAVMCCIAVFVCAPHTSAEEPIDPPRPNMNLFGVTGLIDTPTADMQPDGQFTFTASYFGGFLRNTVTAQIFPGVEGSFRYSVLGDLVAPDTPGADASTLFDRSFDVKVRLLQESSRWPAVAIGLQDLLGTGVYSGEYVTATKGIDAGPYGQFRVTGGIGWGRFAGGGQFENPLRGIDPAFATRDASFGFGGEVSVGQFFRGADLGFFGGVEWQTPIDDLVAKVEYTGDSYDRERQFGDLDIKVPINVGLEYQPIDGIELGAYYMYGSEFGVRISISGNPFRPLNTVDLEPGAQPLRPREPLPNGAELAGLGDVVAMLTGAPTSASFTDPRLKSVVMHTRLGNVRWAEAALTSSEDRCPNDLARAIDAQYGVVDVVTFNGPDGKAVCTIAMRPAGQHAVRLTSRVHANYPVDWYEQEDQRTQLVEILAEELGGDEIGLMGVQIGPRRVEVFIENTKYNATPRAIGRTARALTRTMPPSVEVFEITPVENGLAVSTIILQRSQLEDQVDRPDADRRSWTTAEIRDAKPIAWTDMIAANQTEYPRFSWSILPATPVNFFDPDQPVRFDLSVLAKGRVEFRPGLSVNAAVSKRIVGQLDDITQVSNSQVEERVRSDFARYLREGDPALNRLTIDYVSKFAQTLYGRLSAGLLEQMYAGISGELLWKPVNKSWGLGLELNYVRQRGFNTLFDFRDYETLTGHASLYWNTGYYGISTQVDAGRYLAGDWGATFSMKRRFPSGWELGGFFTLTDIPFDEFGEGSFDKGLFLTIPLNWAAPFETREDIDIALRPLTRDGGQRLNVEDRLWPSVELYDRAHLRTGWEDFWR